MERADDPITNEGADEAHHDVPNNPVASTTEDKSSEPTGDSADHDYRQDGFVAHIGDPSRCD
jgi:hypothetical protein